ncbi:Hypothetical protein HVR_LOCUS559 [uncultured virus]|nr:Hypothetical protein HVR_LOCUS559 [uncultured virus]
MLKKLQEVQSGNISAHGVQPPISPPILPGDSANISSSGSDPQQIENESSLSHSSIPPGQSQGQPDNIPYRTQTLSGPPAQYHTSPHQSASSPSQPNAPPSQQFNAPPSQQFNAPSQQFNAPSQQFNAPPQQFNAPPQQFNAPPQQFNARQQFYGSPQQFNGPPQQFNGPPQQHTWYHNPFAAMQHWYQNQSNNRPSSQQFNGQPSQFNGQPSQFNGQPSQFNGQPSQFNGQPSQFNGQPSQFNGQPSQFNGQPSQFNGQPSQFNGPQYSMMSSSTDKYQQMLKILAQYNILTILDDSGSMDLDGISRNVSRWIEALEAIDMVLRLATQYDDDGVDVFFLNSEHEFNIGRNDKILDKIKEKGIGPRGGTPLGAKLQSIFTNFKNLYTTLKSRGILNTLKPINVIVITDGQPSDEDKVLRSIVDICQFFEDQSANVTEYVGIQLFQVGKDEGARDYLQDLDDNIKNKCKLRSGRCVPDIVDSTCYNPKDPVPLKFTITKVLLGGINTSMDNDTSHEIQAKQQGSAWGSSINWS